MVIYSGLRPGEWHMTAHKRERVADAIRDQISSGQLRPGDRLPSIAKLKELHGVSYSPIYAAMIELKAQGWIVGRQGDGVYVADRPPA